LGEHWNGGQSVEVSGLSAGDVVLSVPLSRLEAGDRYTLIKD
jgi:hypothetical protein